MKEILIVMNSKKGISSATDLFKRIKKIKNIDYKQESFLIFYLDTKNNIIKYDVLFKGGLNSCIVDIKTIFRNALKNNANSIITAHNHPSGHLEPSFEDIEINNKIKEAGDVITIKVLDSIVFNKNSFKRY